MGPTRDRVTKKQGGGGEKKGEIHFRSYCCK